MSADICRGHQAVALENLALRQQLAALTRSSKRPHLRCRDRLFWIGLAHAWRDWRRALMVVQPDTASALARIDPPLLLRNDPGDEHDCDRDRDRDGDRTRALKP